MLIASLKACRNHHPWSSWMEHLGGCRSQATWRWMDILENLQCSAASAVGQVRNATAYQCGPGMLFCVSPLSATGICLRRQDLCKSGARAKRLLDSVCQVVGLSHAKHTDGEEGLFTVSSANSYSKILSSWTSAGLVHTISWFRPRFWQVDCNK